MCGDKHLWAVCSLRMARRHAWTTSHMRKEVRTCDDKYLWAVYMPTCSLGIARRHTSVKKYSVAMINIYEQYIRLPVAWDLHGGTHQPPQTLCSRPPYRNRATEPVMTLIHKQSLQQVIESVMTVICEHSLQQVIQPVVKIIHENSNNLAGILITFALDSFALRSQFCVVNC